MPRAEGLVAQVASPRVIVAQLGARRRYAVPRMLHDHGALCRLYTDLCFPGDLVPGRASGLLGRSLRRRLVQGIPSRLIYAAPAINIHLNLFRTRLAAERYLRADEAAGRTMIGWGVGEANIVYGMYGSGTPYWRHARSCGLKVAGDLFITPMWHAVVSREQDAFPDWGELSKEAPRERELYDRLSQNMIEASDLLICPSETVRDGLLTFAAESPRRGMVVPRTVVVPYGISASGKGAAGTPVPGRILFAGGAELRKGIQYLAAAALALDGSGRHYEFRVAGQVSELVQQHRGARALTFLGHLSREDLDREYRLADILVLPTLAEGSPAVVHEALAAGVPVVTTRSAGSVVTDGREGLIVVERDSDGLAAAIEKIVGDRALREAMAACAINTAANFDEPHWKARLMAALETLLD